MQKLSSFFSDIAGFITTFGSMYLALSISYAGALRFGIEKKFGYFLATYFPLLLCFLSISALLFGTGLYIPGAEKRDIETPDASEILELWPGALWFITFCFLFGFALILFQNMLEEDDNF